MHKSLDVCPQSSSWVPRVLVSALTVTPPPAGSSGTLRLQLLDTAAEAGRGVVLAEAEADLNMQAWESNATYGATLQLKAKKVRGSLCSRWWWGGLINKLWHTDGLMSTS